MTTKSQKTDWRDMIASSLAYQNMNKTGERYRRYIRLMQHRWEKDSDTPLSDDAPVVNMLASRVRAVAPKLAMGVPSWRVKSVFAPPSLNSEGALSEVLKTIWRTEQMASEMKRITDDYALFGPGIGFVGYEASFDEKVIDRQRSLFGVIPVRPGSTLDEIAERLPTFTTEQIKSVQMLLSQRVFMRRTSPLNFAPDPTAEHISSSGFMGRRLFLTRYEAKMLLGDKAPEPKSVANVAYHDTIDPNDPFSTIENDELQHIIAVAVQRVVVWELWDIGERKTVYLDSEGNWIKDDEWRSAHPGFPFVVMNWDDVPDVVQSEGLGAALEPSNRELHLLRSAMASAAKRGKRKYRISTDLDQDAMDALVSDQDGALIPLESDQYAEPLSDASFPGELYQYEERILDSIDQLSQMSAYDTGQGVPGKKTATESAFIQATSDAVTSYRQSQIENFVAEVGERLIAPIISVYDNPIPLRIANRDSALIIRDERVEGGSRTAEIGEEVEFDFIGIDHAGMYAVSVEPGSLVAQAKDMERANLFSAFDRFALQPWFDARAMASYILSTMPGIRNSGDFILTDAEAQAEEKRRAELQGPQPQQGQPGQPEQPGVQPVNPSQPGAQVPGGAGGTVLPESGFEEVGDAFSAFYGANAPNVQQ